MLRRDQTTLTSHTDTAVHIRPAKGKERRAVSRRRYQPDEFIELVEVQRSRQYQRGARQASRMKFEHQASRLGPRVGF